MHRRTFLHSMLAVAASACGSVEQAASAAEHPASLCYDMAFSHVKKHILLTDIFEPWIATLNAISNGRIVIHPVYAEELCANDALYNAVLTDKASLVEFSPCFTVPPLPISSLFNLPQLFTSSSLGSAVFWHMLQHNTALQDELANAHVLSAFVTSPLYLHTTKAVIYPADMRGLKIVVWSSSDVALLQGVEAIPVQVSVANSQKLLHQHMVDGILCPLVSLSSLNLRPILKYTTPLPFSCLPFVVAMNADIWSALPADIQRIFTEASGSQLSTTAGLILDTANAAARAQMTHDGHHFVGISPEIWTQWLQATQFSITDIELSMVKQGFAPVQGFSQALLSTRDTLAPQFAPRADPIFVHYSH